MVSLRYENLMEVDEGSQTTTHKAKIGTKSMNLESSGLPPRCVKNLCDRLFTP